MTLLLFHADSYATEFDAKVEAVRPDGGIMLDRTLFYCTSGGQPHDVGELARKSDGAKVEIKDVRKLDGQAVHIPAAPAPAAGTASSPSPSFAVGDSVHGKIDWTRRHRLMRMHTAGHCLGAVFYSKGILITGNQLGVEQSRFDFSMENFDRALLEACIAEANEKLSQNRPIRVSFMPREEALKLPGMVKLANALPPDIQTLRIVEIEGIDTQADGGTHVKNTSEVGQIELLKLENKGSVNRRIYFALKP
ncbi:MAG: alanyl-tRNA editing protein [Candidatus Micrarchaeota archaeon]|nr:alanyl-tRNA editing protein [Candidatus Micrarchaeota archaeon]